MAKYNFKCDYCQKKFLNTKIFKRVHKNSVLHKKNVYFYYQNQIRGSRSF